MILFRKCILVYRYHLIAVRVHGVRRLQPGASFSNVRPQALANIGPLHGSNCRTKRIYVVAFKEQARFPVFDIRNGTASLGDNARDIGGQHRLQARQRLGLIPRRRHDQSPAPVVAVLNLTGIAPTFERQIRVSAPQSLKLRPITAQHARQAKRRKRSTEQFRVFLFVESADEQVEPLALHIVIAVIELRTSAINGIRQIDRAFIKPLPT